MNPAVRQLLMGSGKRLALADNFERADTADGTIGADWDLRGVYAGSYPLPAATVGRITSGRFVADANQTVYATKQMDRPQRKLTANVSWVPNGGVTALSTVALIIAPDNKIIDTMLHITVNRGGANIQKRIAGGSFVTLASLTFSPSLTNGGVIHPITVEVFGNNSVTLNVSGRTARATDVDIPRVLGPFICFEIFNTSADMVDLVRFEDVATYQ